MSLEFNVKKLENLMWKNLFEKRFFKKPQCCWDGRETSVLRNN